MYICSKCKKAIIVIDSEIIRACPSECANEPIIAEAEATMSGNGNVKN
jgi:hypothetical protein